jgi:hypothetical protein
MVVSDVEGMSTGMLFPSGSLSDVVEYGENVSTIDFKVGFESRVKTTCPRSADVPPATETPTSGIAYRSPAVTDVPLAVVVMSGAKSEFEPKM